MAFLEKVKYNITMHSWIHTPIVWNFRLIFELIVGGALSSYLSEHSENMLVFGTHYDNPVSNEATMRFDLQKAAE